MLRNTYQGSPMQPTRTESPITPGLVEALARIVGADGVLAELSDLLPYECDGYTLETSIPSAVVLPRSTDEVQRVVRILHQHRVPFVPRGAGTSLAGGTLAPPSSVMVGTARMRRVLELDPEARFARVEAGLVNLELSRAALDHRLHFAPDPSSQSACTVGGNVATNSGGPHTLKYGVTTNHVIGLTLVLPDGRLLEVGGPAPDPPGLDLVGLVVGHEGTFGVVTEVTVRLIPLPPALKTMLAVFDSAAAASQAISGIIGAGIVPAALEMMDRDILRAVEDAYHLGLPLDAEAVLLIEIDGYEVGLEPCAQRIMQLCQKSGVREFRVARDEAERAGLWKGRKHAFGAIGRLAPNYCTQDGVVPRTRVPEILARIRQIAERYQLRIPNVFHAGDGNVHPILLYDERDPDQMRRVIDASRDILEACLELGGSVTGEHGIGVEKISMLAAMFSDADLEVMRAVRDTFNPEGLCNPNKVLATNAGACVERTHPGRQAPM
jgi:glycolate oxidase